MKKVIYIGINEKDQGQLNIVPSLREARQIANEYDMFSGKESWIASIHIIPEAGKEKFIGYAVCSR